MPTVDVPEGYLSSLWVGSWNVTHGARDVDDEGEDGYDDECPEGLGVH